MNDSSSESSTRALSSPNPDPTAVSSGHLSFFCRANPGYNCHRHY